VGLEYVKLGQPVPTLSGGEAQRLKLAGHLAEAAADDTPSIRGKLFLFDEPTTGLHFDDVAKLLRAFRKLLKIGHSLLVIEHNLDVIRAADWIIDLGPEGGDGGGEIVVTGTPAQVEANPRSHTGKALRDYEAQMGTVPDSQQKGTVTGSKSEGASSGMGTVPFSRRAVAEAQHAVFVHLHRASGDAVEREIEADVDAGLAGHSFGVAVRGKAAGVVNDVVRLTEVDQLLPRRPDQHVVHEQGVIGPCADNPRLRPVFRVPAGKGVVSWSSSVPSARGDHVLAAVFIDQLRFGRRLEVAPAVRASSILNCPM